MKTPDAEGLLLPALNGANPLGFLAALGTLLTLRQGGHPRARLGWRCKVHWMPLLQGLETADSQRLADDLAKALAGNRIEDSAEAIRESAAQEYDAAKKAMKEAVAMLKKRKLKGAERTNAHAREVKPLDEELQLKRQAWLSALKKAVPSEELALGRHIDCRPSEYVEHADGFLAAATQNSRRAIDLLAAFGSDAVVDKYGRVGSTPFCFITGSGHQYFLDTVRQLIAEVTPERIHRALFCAWDYRDEKLSMRWDPSEDRRYALMDRNPTASDNKSRTVWMANLLAYRGLALFPVAATEHRMATTGWRETPQGPVFTWGLWENALSPDVIRSLLQVRELQENPKADLLSARGIAAVFRARRIQVGNPPLHKINFTPATGV